MKSLWKIILDGLTYKDLAGKRQPRVYTVVTGLILLLLLMAGGMAGLESLLTDANGASHTGSGLDPNRNKAAFGNRNSCQQKQPG